MELVDELELLVKKKMLFSMEIILPFQMELQQLEWSQLGRDCPTEFCCN